MTIELMVRSIRIETAEVRSFELVSLNGPLPAWQAGAHIVVQAAPGIRRAYSLCNHREDTDCYRIAVKREAASRGGSAAMHTLAVGTRIQVEPPANLFEIDPQARRHILIAGGIGITPLYAMRNTLIAQGKLVSLHYFARSAAHAVFSSRLDNETTLHLGLDAKRTNECMGQIIQRHASEKMNTFYLCGPTAFMDAISTALTDAGIDPQRLRQECFKPTDMPAPQDKKFQVHFARSGITVDVPVGKSILTVARELGVEMPSGCEMGVCGACQSTVLEGRPDHRDNYLSIEEQSSGKCILPCISRASGELLILDC
jgi:vanillate monooxygenase ferredoxin subunit